MQSQGAAPAPAEVLQTFPCSLDLRSGLTAGNQQQDFILGNKFISVLSTGLVIKAVVTLLTAPEELEFVCDGVLEGVTELGMWQELSCAVPGTPLGTGGSLLPWEEFCKLS